MYVMQNGVALRTIRLALLIQALRKVSQELVILLIREGRQQLALKRVSAGIFFRQVIGCHPDLVTPQMHPEQGPVWEWIYRNTPEIMEKIGAIINRRVRDP